MKQTIIYKGHYLTVEVEREGGKITEAQKDRALKESLDFDTVCVCGGKWAFKRIMGREAIGFDYSK